MAGPYASPWTAVLAVGGGGAVVSVVISPIADRLTLTPVAPTVTVLVDGVPTVPDSYLWEAVGPAGVTGGGTATPTITPVANGMVGVSCAVVVDGETYHSAVVEFRVGDVDGKIQVHHADWTDAGSAVDFGGGALSKTINGLTYDRYMPGTVFSFAATAGVGLSIDSNSADAGVRIAGNALSVGMETDAVYYVALAAGTLNNDGDQVSLVISCASGDWATAYAVRSGGVQRIGTYTSAGQRDEPTAGGGQVRQMALRVRGYQVEVYYSETAFVGSFLALSEMIKATSAPAGFFTMSTVMHGGASVDRRVPASDTVWWIVPIASTGPVTITHTEIRRSQPGGGASDGPPPTVIATISAIADQLDLSAVTLTIAVTVDGSTVTPDAVAWLVNGAATGIADATATPTTHIPTDGGVHVVTCAVTVDGIVYYAEAESYTVGIAASDGGHWVVDWELDPATAADHDFKVGPLTHDGVTLTLDGTADTAEITSGVLTLKPTGPADIFLWSLGNEPSTVLGRDVCWMVAFGADLTANNDGVLILYGNSGTTVYGFAEARNVSGAQQVDMQRAGTTPKYDATAGGGQAQIVGLRLAGRYSMQCVYSETALSGGAWPAPSSMSKHDKVPSGWYTLDDSSPADSADSLAAATDRVRVVQVRGANARSYTITRLARLVRA